MQADLLNEVGQGEALAYCKTFLSEFCASRSKKDFIASLPSFEGLAPPSKNTIEALRSDPDRINRNNITARTKQYIVLWGQRQAVSCNPQKAFYDMLLKNCGEDKTSQALLSKLAGDWTSYRKSSEKGHFITGKYIFQYKFDFGSFQHVSEQSIERDGAAPEKKSFSHDGVVILLHGNVHLFGSGKGYIRPEILRPIDEDRCNVLLGILLTEKWESHGVHTPLGTKTILIKDGYPDAQSYLDNLERYLSSAAAVDGLLYGVKAEAIQFDNRSPD